MEIPRLPHAYIPGRSPRHSENAFDDLCRSVVPGMTPDELVGTDAWRAGLTYIDTGFNWEAHEVLEPVWMVLPVGSDERVFVQALIQFANARLKAEMQRPRAVVRLCGIVSDLLNTLPKGRAVMGQMPDVLGTKIEELRVSVENQAI